MSLNLNIEILNRDEAEAYFKRQIDETHLAPYVDFVSKLEIGDAFRVPIEKGTDAESARTLKRNFNAAAKLRKANVIVRDAADANGKLEDAPEGTYRSFVGLEDGKSKAVFRQLNEEPAPVLLRWKADTHKEKKTTTKDGKSVTVDVIIVDKLVGKLAATVARSATTAAAHDAVFIDGKCSTCGLGVSEHPEPPTDAPDGGKAPGEAIPEHQPIPQTEGEPPAAPTPDAPAETPGAPTEPPAETPPAEAPAETPTPITARREVATSRR